VAVANVTIIIMAAIVVGRLLPAAGACHGHRSAQQAKNYREKARQAEKNCTCKRVLGIIRYLRPAD
jgi:hypothetical protein